MPKIAYKEINFHPATLRIIEQANSIIREFQGQGYDLTLRQLYYQFVSRDLIRNKQSEYDRLGAIINDARLAGHIDWLAIIDRTRNLRQLPFWDSPADVVEAVSKQFDVDRWEDQRNYVEVWIEKDALAGVFERVCNRYAVPFFSCRGYTSQSEMWVAAQRFLEKEDEGKRTHILHFGDHDPSGMDMTRDIQDRLTMFEAGTTVTRVALNMDQIRKYNPPPNPAKLTDSRCHAYIAQYGPSSWELDALPPNVLADLVDQEVQTILDFELYEAQLERIKEGRALLKIASNNWSDIATHVRKTYKADFKRLKAELEIEDDEEDGEE